jgi:single-stranded DNA-binding protein
MSSHVYTGRLAGDWRVYDAGTENMRAINRLAVSNGYYTKKDEEGNDVRVEREASFLPLIVWGAAAKYCSEMSGKGFLVSIDAQLKTQQGRHGTITFEDDGTEERVWFQRFELKVLRLLSAQAPKKSGAPRQASQTNPTADRLQAMLSDASEEDRTQLKEVLSRIQKSADAKKPETEKTASNNYPF